MHIQSLMRNTWIILSLASPLCGEQLLVKTPSGYTIAVDIEPEAPFSDVIRQIEDEVQEAEQTEGCQDEEVDHQFFLDFSYRTPLSFRATLAPRNYAHIITSSERTDIRYILKTLAKSTWTELLKSKSSLKKAGDRIDHIHPLRFLACVLNDQELNGCLHTIHDRSKVWKEFFGGLSKSLGEEAARSNMGNELIQDFANSIKIDASPLFTPVAQGQWSDFLSILMQMIPRNGNPDRHDI